MRHVDLSDGALAGAPAHWLAVASLVTVYCGDIGFAQSSSVFLESPAMTWVKPNDEATIRWSVNDDVDLMTASIDVISGSQEVFNWAPGIAQPEFYQSNGAERYSQLTRDSSTLRFKLRQIQASDMGKKFKCILSYEDNTHKSEDVVIVVDAAPSQPRIDTTPKFPVPEGTDVRIDCTSNSDRSLSNYSTGLVYEWITPGISSQRYRTHDNILDITNIQRGDNNTRIGCKVRERLSDWLLIEEIVVMVTATNIGPPGNRPVSTSPAFDDKGSQTLHSAERSTEDETGILSTPHAIKPERQTNEAQERKVLYGVIGSLLGVFFLIALSCWIGRRRSNPKSPNSDTVPALIADKDLTQQLSVSSTGRNVCAASYPRVPQEVIIEEDVAGDYSLIGDMLRGPLPGVPDSSLVSGPASGYLQSTSSDREVLNGLVYGNTASTRNLANVANERPDSPPSETSSPSGAHLSPEQALRMDISSEYLTILDTEPKFDIGDGDSITTMDSALDETHVKSVAQSPADNHYSAHPRIT